MLSFRLMSTLTQSFSTSKEKRNLKLTPFTYLLTDDDKAAMKGSGQAEVGIRLPPHTLANTAKHNAQFMY